MADHLKQRLRELEAQAAAEAHPGMGSADRTMTRIMAESAAAGARATGTSPPPSIGEPLSAPVGPLRDDQQTCDDQPPNVVAQELRPVEPICLNGAEPAAIPTEAPVYMDVDPRTLVVEASYQRDLSPKSVALIRKIALRWDWRRFRPPVVVMSDAGGLVIDGQHTCAGAVSRGLTSIPVQVIDAPEIKVRAETFVGLNKDRLALTPVQLHHAAVAAGDETAITVEQVCHRAGVTIVRSAYGAYKWKPGETMAVNAIRDLIDRRGAMKARMLLQALAQAGCAPVAAHEIKAAEHLFSHDDFAGELEPLADGGGADLALVVKALGDGAAKDAKMFAATHCVPYWKGLAATWFKKCRKRRKAA
jgi:hypothetical protein